MTNDEVCCIVEDCAQEAGVPLISEELDHLRRIPNNYLHQHDAIFKAGDPSILEIYFHFENDVYNKEVQKLTADATQQLRLSAVKGSCAL